MQTNFTPKQLKNPRLAEIDKILRRCVHCGFCTATCPTYVLLGDERDSPRGRIYLMKEMFENDRPASPEVQHHVDRCLSCLSCMTTCPSGVDYMHLVDYARAHIEQTARRGIKERMARAMLAAILPYPDRFRLALRGATVRQAVHGTAAPSRAARSWWRCWRWRRPGCCAAPTSPDPAPPRPRPSAGGA